MHLEPTDVCQAACPMCRRETDLDFNKSLKHHLTITQIKKHFDDRAISKLDKMFMCGNLGDPAAGKYTLDIYREFRRINPDIVLGMNTNGAIQNTFWWNELGGMLNRLRDFCVFSIDGLADTNSTYRVGVNWDRLMANAEAFISAGGRAHWDMLVYRHNQHQVDACQQLAKDMGFKWFRAKVTNRGFNEGLQPPTEWQIPTVSWQGKIKCLTLQEKEAYIDAQGRASVCGWMSLKEGNFINDIDKLRVTWKTDSPHPVCSRNCTVVKNQTNWESQYKREVEFE